MHLADNDNGPTLRLTIDLDTSRQIDQLKDRIGAEDETELLELALAAYEEFGAGTNDFPPRRSDGAELLEMAFPLSPWSREILNGARVRSGLSDVEITERALSVLLGCRGHETRGATMIAFLRP